MPLTYKPSYQDASPVVKRIYITPDPEGRTDDNTKIAKLMADLQIAFPKETTETADITEYNLGDWTDHGTDPLATCERIAKTTKKIPGNRDFNFMRFLYELDEKYIAHTYTILETIAAGKTGDYAEFYKDGKLKTGADFLKTVEDVKFAALRYKHPTATNTFIPLAWVDPNKQDFKTWVDKAINTFGGTNFSALSAQAKEVLYLQYMNEQTRGAPDAFMHWAIDLANKTDNGDTADFKKKALTLYKALKDIKADDRDYITKYQAAYLALRKHLNTGFKLTGASDTELLNYTNSFELETLKFFKNPTQIMALLKDSDIAVVIGTGKNKVLLVHGGIADPQDLSLPDGHPAAANIDEFISRFNESRDTFFRLYENPSRNADDEEAYITLARGFMLMGLQRQALKDAKFHDHPYLNGATASVDHNAAVDKGVQSLYTGFVGQFHGHQPTKEFFAGQMPDNKFMVGLDTTQYNKGQAVTAAAVYLHADEAQTVAVHAISETGEEISVELGTYDKNGHRIWPKDPNKVIEQVLVGAVVELSPEQAVKQIQSDGNLKNTFTALTGTDAENALKAFRAGWRAKYLKDGNMVLHQGGNFEKQYGSKIFFNSTLSLDWNTVAHKSGKNNELDTALLTAGRRMSIDKPTLLGTGAEGADAKIAAVKNLQELQAVALLFESNLNVHKNPTFDRMLTWPKLNMRKENTNSWLAFRDKAIEKAEALIIESAQNAADKVADIKAIKEFDSFLIKNFGVNDLKDWHKTDLPEALFSAFWKRVETIDFLAAGSLASDKAESLKKLIDHYAQCIRPDLTSTLGYNIKETFRDNCLKKVRAHVTEALADAMPKKPEATTEDNAAVVSEYIGQLEAYLGQLNELKTLDFFKNHRSNHWYTGAVGRTDAVISIDNLTKQVIVELDTMRAPGATLVK